MHAWLNKENYDCNYMIPEGRRIKNYVILQNIFKFVGTQRRTQGGAGPSPHGGPKITIFTPKSMILRLCKKIFVVNFRQNQGLCRKT